MQYHVQIYISVLYAVAVCSSAALPSANPAVQNPGLLALPDIPDKDFRYVAAYHEPSISVNASIMACVAAMCELAHLDINSYMRNEESWTHPEHPQVSVTVYGVGGARQSVRFATFLIQAGIKDMMIRQRYEKAVFFGWYREVNIGYVVFDATQTQSAKETQISSTARVERNSSGVSFDLQLPSTKGTLTSGDKLHAQIDYLDKAMDKRDSFFTIIWLLMAFGSHSDEPLRVFHSTITSVAAQVRTVWNTVKSPGSLPYVLKAADMINMIAHLPVVLLEAGTFREMNIVISDNGVELAKGAIRTRPLPRRPVVGSLTNITVS